jgi:hypothetical protein
LDPNLVGGIKTGVPDAIRHEFRREQLRVLQDDLRQVQISERAPNEECDPRGCG